MRITNKLAERVLTVLTKTQKALSSVTILLLVSRLLGFIREMVIAAYFGATWQTDAFNMAINIVILSTAIISVGVATVVIPVYNKKTETHSKETADLFVSNILWIFSFIYVAISVAGIIFAPYLVRVFALNFNAETAALTTLMVRVMLAVAALQNVVNFLSSISRANNRFTMPSLIGFPVSIITIGSVVFLSERMGIHALVFAFIAYTTIQAAMLSVSLRKVFRLKLFISFTNGDLKDVVLLSLPIYLSIAVAEINMVVDRMLASGLPEGSITALNFALRVRGLPDALIIAPLVTVVFPLLSQHAARNDVKLVKSLTIRSLSVVFLTLIPVAAISMFYSTEIVQIVFERGAFTAERTQLTAGIFFYLIASVVFIGAYTMLANAFYSVQDTKTPQISAVVFVMCNIALNIILVRHMQAAGLALATTISCIIYFILLLVLYRRKFGAFGGLKLAKNTCKCLFATVCMLPIFHTAEILREQLPLFVFFGTASLISLGVYAVILIILKEEMILEGFAKVKNIVLNTPLG